MLRRHSLNTSFWLANKKKTMRKTAEKSKWKYKNKFFICFHIETNKEEIWKRAEINGGKMSSADLLARK